ncbi:MAG: aldehyde dehydrogenase family protein, partial [Ilumatobacter sp.]|nr:aldehyde dehydrogenase family protein [Ilumatobacter sp.]
AGAADWNARILTGGGEPAGKGFFYEPTVLTGVDPQAPILREEIFGPVAPIVSFDHLEDAIALANDTEYGLISYVYGGDVAAAVADAGFTGLYVDANAISPEAARSIAMRLPLFGSTGRGPMASVSS